MMSQQMVDMRDDKKHHGLGRMMAVVGIGYLFLIIVDPRNGLPKLSIQYLLKDDLHLDATQIANFLALSAFAWYCKPLAGLLTDSFPLFGTRRKGYLILSTFATAGFWLGLAVFPHTSATLFWSMIVINVGLMIAQTTLGGMMVEAGQEHRATGRLSSARMGGEYSGILLGGLASGWVAARFLRPGFVASAILLAIFIALVVWLVKERPKSESEEPKEGVLNQTVNQLTALFKSRTLWIATGFWMLVRFAPGFDTPLFFYKSETLKITKEFMGVIAFTNAGAAIAGSLIYLWACRRYPLDKLLYFGVIVNVLSTIIFFAYKSSFSGLIVEGIHGLGNSLAFMAILDLLARATPKRSEALGYALIFSLGNISVAFSDIGGSWLYEKLQRSFMSMVWLNSATSALVLLAIPFLPKVLVAHRDGQLTTLDVK